MILRELLTLIGFEVDDKGLKTFERSINSVQKSLLYVGGAITGAATALFGLVKNVANVGDEILNSSKELGLSTDALQEWRYAADQAGISNDELATSIKMFSRNVGQAATNATGPFVDRLGQLGVRLTDANGQLKDNDTLLLEVADALSTVKDAQLKGIIAQEFFGRSGLRMASFLSEGSKSVQDLRNKAKELGIVLDRDAVNAAAALEDKLSTVFDVVKSLKNEIGVALMPIINDLADVFLLWVQVNRDLLKQRVVDFFKSVMKYAGYLAKAIDLLIDAFEWLVETMGSVDKAIIVLVSTFMLIKLSPLIILIGKATFALWQFLAGLIAVEAGILLVPIAISLMVALLYLAAQELLDFFGIIEEGDKISPFEALIKALATVFGLFLLLKVGDFIIWLYKLAAAAWTVAGGTAAMFAPFLVLIGLLAVIAYGAYKVYETFSDMLGSFTFVDKMKAAWVYLKAWLGSFFDNMGDWLSEKYNKIIDGFVEKLTWLKDKIKELNPFATDESQPQRKGTLGEPLSFPEKGNQNTRVGTIGNFFRGVASESQAMAVSPTALPQQIVRAGNNTSSTITNNRPVNVTSNVNVTMPPGTSGSVEKDFTAAIKAAWQEETQRLLETALYNNAEQE